MATVRELVDLVVAMAPDLRDPLQLRSKLPIINAAALSMWRVLVSRDSQNNWFLVTSQSTSAAADDYFAKLVSGTREYSLPPNFHKLRSFEVLTDPYKHLVFKKAKVDADSFLSDRVSAEQISSVAYYDITGINPGKLRLGKNPPAEIDVQLSYVRKLTSITSYDDSLADFPDHVLLPMAEWVLKANTLGMQDGRFTAFLNQWQNEVEQFVFTGNRDNTGRNTVVGYLEDW